jgi:amidophosphoribosyltransferase
MCGIIGIIGKTKAIDFIYPGLIALQHRGQDSAGAVTYAQTFHLKKGSGLVANVFNLKNIARLDGNIGIGHVRYPTVGPGGIEDAQPFVLTMPYGIALAHNGNLVNYFDLKNEIIEKHLRYLNSNCDAEVILNVFSIELSKMDLKNFDPEVLFSCLKGVYHKLIGSFAVVCFFVL